MTIEQVAIFRPGQRIRQVSGVAISGMELREGQVVRQDADSRFALIRWDDGGLDWRLTATLEISPDSKKKKAAEIKIDDSTLE